MTGRGRRCNRRRCRRCRCRRDRDRDVECGGLVGAGPGTEGHQRHPDKGGNHHHAQRDCPLCPEILHAAKLCGGGPNVRAMDDEHEVPNDDGEPAPEPWERPIDKFKRGAAGSVIAAGLLGVRDALEGRPEREEPAIVSEAPEPKLDHIDIVLDPDHPERSRAVVYLPPHDDGG